MRREEHQRILEACIEHRPAAARAELHNHLVRTANLVSEAMGGDDLFKPVDMPKSSRRRSASARGRRA